MAIIGTLALALTARTGRFEKAMKRANVVTRSVGNTVRFVRNQFLKFGGAIGITSALSGVGLGALAKKQIDLLDQTVKISQRLGIQVGELQKLEFAASQSGVQVNQLRLGIQRMTRRVAEAAKGTGEAQGAIKELGLDAGEFAKLSPDQQLRQLADAFGKVEGQSDKVRLAFKLFDSEGVSLLQLLQQGRGGIDKLAAEFESFGGVLDKEGAGKIVAAREALGSLSARFGAFKTQLAVGVAPLLVLVSNLFGEGGKAGEAFGKAVVDAVRWVVMRIGDLLDVMNLVEGGWFKIQQAALNVVAFIIDALTELLKVAERAVQFTINAANRLSGLVGLPQLEADTTGVLSSRTRAAVESLQLSASKAGDRATTALEDYETGAGSRSILERFERALEARNEGPTPVSIDDIPAPTFDDLEKNVEDIKDLEQEQSDRFLEALLGTPFALTRIADQIRIALFRQPHTVVKLGSG